MYLGKGGGVLKSSSLNFSWLKLTELVEARNLLNGYLGTTSQEKVIKLEFKKMYLN